MKILSVIVPSYNMEKYMPKCLGSLIVDDAALLQQLDIIVVNDGSKDRTSEIAHEFEKKYPGVFRVIDKPNGNYGSCVNAGLKIAAGRFVKILDADDSYDTVALRDYLTRLATVPENIDALLSDYVIVDEEGKVMGSVGYALDEGCTYKPDDLVDFNCNMAMHAICYRTSMLMSIGYQQIEGISYTDTQWFYLPAAAAQNWRYFRLPVYRYLVGRPGQTMDSSVWARNYRMLERICDRMFSQFDEYKTNSLFCRRYLERQLQRIVSLLTITCASRVPLAEINGPFEKLRSYILQYNFIKEFLDNEMILRSTPIRFSYISFAAIHPRFRLCVLALVRVYSMLNQFLHVK